MTESTVSRIEGQQHNPRLKTIERVLRACELELAVVPRLGLGIDRTQIRERLRLTPRERIEQGASAATAVEAFAGRAALDAHYRNHPHAQPSLAEVALAAAQIDGNPLADKPDCIRQAANEISAIDNNPGPDDVLAYAAQIVRNTPG